MTHRHYVVFATLLALPVTVAAQVTQAKPKAPVGAKPIPSVGTKIVTPSEYRDLIEHAKVYGQYIDGVQVYSVPQIKGQVADQMGLYGDVHIKAPIGDALHLLQEPKIAKYIDANTTVYGHELDALTYIKAHDLSAPKQTVW